MIVPLDAFVIYNYKTIDPNLLKQKALEVFKPITGKVSFLDSNNDDIYEMVKIYNYQTFAVDNVTKLDERIYLKNDATFNGKDLLDNIVLPFEKSQVQSNSVNYIETTNEPDKTVRILDSDNKEIGLDLVKDSSIIDVAVSTNRVGKKLITIKIVDKTVSGEIKELSYEGGKQKVKINDKWYYVESGLKKYIETKSVNQLELGFNVIFCLNSLNELAYVDLNGVDRFRYGFLVKCIKDGNGLLSKAQ